MVDEKERKMVGLKAERVAGRATRAAATAALNMVGDVDGCNFTERLK